MMSRDNVEGMSSDHVEGATPALFPLFLKLAGRKCVIVGAGSIATQKLQGLLDSGADIQIIAPTASAEIQQLTGGPQATNNADFPRVAHSSPPVGLEWGSGNNTPSPTNLQWIQAEFAPSHLVGALLVIAATGDPSVNQRVYHAAQEQGVLCNAVDEPAHCDFYYPAIVRRGDLQIAISTAGKSPALAQRIRKQLEQQFDASYANWVQWLGNVRELLFTRQVEPALRTRTLHRICAPSIYERYRARRAANDPGDRSANAVQNGGRRG
jgi:precorrin-2 dehydrogenase/sirohydrochlorin ferrochelatase